MRIWGSHSAANGARLGSNQRPPACEAELVAAHGPGHPPRPQARYLSMPADYDPARRFIARAGWKFAKTVPVKPHEYAVEAQNPGPDFNAFHALIEEQGYRESFEGARYRYFRVDDYEYWTSHSWFGGGRMLTAATAPTPMGQRRRRPRR
jgi:hypothetical protein